MKKLILSLTIILYVNLLTTASKSESTHRSNNYSVLGNSGSGINRESQVLPSFVNLETNWHNYSTDDGLVNDSANTVAIDLQNIIWIGTNNGVSEFDGVNWTTYSTSNGLVDNNINSIVIDAQGKKWFATVGGVSVFDNSNWVTYDSTNSGLVSNWVWTIAFDNQGNTWFGTYGYGVSVFNGNKWTTYNTSNSGLLNNNVTSIAFDQNGVAWLTSDNGVSSFDGKNWTTYSSSNGLSTTFAGSIAVDSLNNIWVGTNEGLYEYNGSYWTVFNVTNSGILDDTVQAVEIDNNGAVWVGTNNHGLCRFKGTTWEIFSKSASVGNNIAIDNRGNKWIPTYTGVLEINDSRIINVNSQTNEVNFNVVSDVNWSISGQPTWFSLSPTSGSTNALVTVNIQANTNLSNRTDQLIISSSQAPNDTLTINQSFGNGTGISESQENNIAVYPNPVHNEVFLSVSNVENSYNVDLYTINGVKIFNTIIENNITDIEMNNYPNGVYILKINSPQGIITRKIIKE